MLDLAIRGGDVIDGTGTKRRRADIGVAAGRIVELGTLTDSAQTEVDASGQIVAPGFIDVHTHLDVQGFWDPTLSPSPLHGVTTVIGGNCGFSVAPLDDASAEYLIGMLSKVEAMPLSALMAGVPWDWRTTSEYLARLDGRLAVNAGFMVGHSPVRRVVMGEASTVREATKDEIGLMQALVREGISAGALGFSTSWGFAHRDSSGTPVPSIHASAEELVALAAVCGEFDGTSLEFIPPQASVRFSEGVLDVMADMSAAARRPLNWNLMVPDETNEDVCFHNLTAYDIAKKRGGHVVALTNPFSSSLRLTFETGFLLEGLNGWAETMALPRDEKLCVLKDRDQRRRLQDLAALPSPAFQLLASDWGRHFIFDTHSADTVRYSGRFVRDIAAEEGKSSFDALLDIVCADDLRTGFGRPQPRESDRDRKVRSRIWDDGRAVIGGSDAGAHLDMLATFNLTTVFVQKAVRESALLSVEEAVRHLTRVPAELYGLRDRGQLTPGAYADIVVFDEATIGSQPVVVRHDLPGGAGRLYAGAFGISHVIVNGSIIAIDGEFTESRPGAVLRSGADTFTSHVMGANT